MQGRHCSQCWWPTALLAFTPVRCVSVSLPCKNVTWCWRVYAAVKVSSCISKTMMTESEQIILKFEQNDEQLLVLLLKLKRREKMWTAVELIEAQGGRIFCA